MIREKNQFSKFAITEIIIATLISIFTTFRNGSVVSALFYASFIIILMYLRHFLSKFPLLPLVLIAVCMFNVIQNALLSGGNVSFDYMKKLFMFSAFVLTMHYACSDGDSLDKKSITLIKLIPLFGAIELIISFLFLGNTETFAHGITLGFSNPNFTGMWVFHFILYAIILLLDSKEHKHKWWMRILLISVIGLLSWLLYFTETRSCFIALAAFLLLLVLGYFNIRIPPWACILIAAFPLILAIFYLNYVNSDWVRNTFSFMVSEGKSLTSRVWIWNRSLGFFYRHPLTGDYYGISGGTGQSQLHNTHIDILCSYGIIPLALFIALLTRTLRLMLKKVESFKQYAAFVAFCTVIIMGSFEAAVVSGAMGMNLLSVGLIGLTICRSDRS